MNERERLINLLESQIDLPRSRIELIAYSLINNGVIALPVNVGSPCKIQKVITRKNGKIKKIKVEKAVVRGVCVLTENENGNQIMSLSNVLPDLDG